MGWSLITRKGWGARASRGASTLARTKGVKFHYTGGHESIGPGDDHALCAGRVRQIQAQHMDDNGWNDLGYSLIVCIHGKIFEGRGVHVLPAANGKGLNSDHYAVCVLVGNAGVTVPGAETYAGMCEAIGYLRAEGDAGPEVRAHRDGYATDCPGLIIYAWVRSGTPCATHSDDTGDEDMPKYVSLSMGKTAPLAADKWTTIPWHVENVDATHQHADDGGPSVLNGPARYGLTASITLEGLPAGAEYQVRAVEVDAVGKETADLGPIGEGVASSGKTYILYNLAADSVDEGRRVRVQVKPLGHAATAAAGTCKVTYWR